MTVGDDPDKWLTFLAGLELVHGSKEDRLVKGFNIMHRSEIAKVCRWLDQLKITSGERNISYGAPSKCDLCEADLLDGGLYVDGAIKGGSWANACMSCFDKHGMGIGWGVGQLYKRKGSFASGDPLWVCIAGGNQQPILEENTDDQDD
jgi:hypothetical protein